MMICQSVGEQIASQKETLESPATHAVICEIGRTGYICSTRRASETAKFFNSGSQLLDVNEASAPKLSRGPAVLSPLSSPRLRWDNDYRGLLRVKHSFQPTDLHMLEDDVDTANSQRFPSQMVNYAPAKRDGTDR